MSAPRTVKNKMSASTRGQPHGGYTLFPYQEKAARTQLRKMYTKELYQEKKMSVYGT